MQTAMAFYQLPLCTFCQGRDAPADNVEALFDGRTIYGSWAFMCQEHFDLLGTGLGPGFGQRLVMADDIAISGATFEHHGTDHPEEPKNYFDIMMDEIGEE